MNHLTDCTSARHRVLLDAGNVCSCVCHTNRRARRRVEPQALHPDLNPDHRDASGVPADAKG